MEGNVTGDVAIALKAMRGLTAQGFDSAYLPPIIAPAVGPVPGFLNQVEDSSNLSGGTTSIAP